jgi:hypothetical protein
MGAIGLTASLGIVGWAIGQVMPTQLILLVMIAIAWRAALSVESAGWPERRRQIPRWWVQPATPYGLMLGGLALGSGVFTHIRYALFYLMLASAVATGMDGAYMAIAIGAIYGATNGVTPLMQSGSAEALRARSYRRVLAIEIGLARITGIVAVATGVLILMTS